ncbi:serine hydrolase domain-containing protein [Lacunimicrobium album]
MPNRRQFLSTSIVSAIAASMTQSSPSLAFAQQPKRKSTPVALEMDFARLAYIDEIVEEGIRQEKMPGCVVLIGRRAGIAYHKAYGNLSLKPDVRPMLTDTVFDLASLTKPIATATSIMLLVERGQIDITKPVADYEPDFANNGKESITVLQLLTHQSGLIPDNPLADYLQSADDAFRRLLLLKPVATPGEKFMYSDVNFIMLGYLVKKITGLNVNEFSHQEIFSPLGMSETGYNPAEPLRERAALTQEREGRWMRGEVHDPRAYKLDGIAGHAGLFSTASDLSRYATMLLNKGELNGRRIFKPETIDFMTTPVKVPGGLRGLGWDIRTGYSSQRGDMMSSRAYGHGGFTGTSLWIDPVRDLYVIFLSNRVHPDGKGSVNPLIGRVSTVAVASLQDFQAEE